MRALVLNRFGLSAMHYPQWLGDDVEVSMITKASCVGDPASVGPGTGYARVELVEDYDTGAVVELLAQDWHGERPFDLLVALSEFDLLRAARLRDVLCIDGQDWDSAVAYRDKVEMKRRLNAHGVPTAPWGTVRGACDVTAFARDHGYPVVVKPRRGAASQRVAILADAAEAAAYLRREEELRRDDDPGLIVEGYVENRLVHVDGAVFGGEVVLSCPSWCSDTLGFRTGAVLRSAMMERGDAFHDPAQRLTAAMIAALPTPRVTLFHAELFVTPDGRMLANEIASRIGGGRIKTALEVAFGVNTEEWYVRSVHRPEPWPLPRGEPEPLAGFTLFPSLRGGVLEAAPEACDLPGVRKYRLESPVGSTITPASSSVDVLATVTVEGRSAEEVGRRLAAAETWFYSSLKIRSEDGTAGGSSPLPGGSG